MKLTKNVVRQFEKDQQEFGTKVALYNIIWQLAAGLLKDIGVRGIKTTADKS